MTAVQKLPQIKVVCGYNFDIIIKVSLLNMINSLLRFINLSKKFLDHKNGNVNEITTQSLYTL